MAALPLALLLITTLLGAGLVPGVTPPLAAAWLAAACLRPLPTERAWRCWAWLLLTFALWTALATLPIGGLAGPWRAGLGADAQAFLAQYGALCGGPQATPPTAVRLSLHPSGSLRWLMLILGAGGAYALAASLRTRQRILLAKGLVILGGLVAAAGVMGRVLIPQGDFLLWWYPVSEIGGGVSLGPFVNRNHFAAFCALLAPLALALTCHWRRSIWADADDGADLPGAASLYVSFGERLLYGTCLLTMAAAILVSRSRGGTAALLIGLVLLALLWFRSGPAAAAAATLAGVGAFVLVAVWPDPEFQGRLQGLRDTATAIGARWPVWGDCLRVWRQVPLAGCGANAFGMVFPRITAWAVGQQATHAESDVLQLLAEGGAIGALLAVGVLMAACWLLLRALLNPRSAPALRLPYPLLAGVAGGVAAIAFSSLVDIALRVPLAAWTAASVAGLAAPAPLRRGRSYARGAWLCPERLVPILALIAVLCVGWRAPGWRALYRDRDAWLAEAASREIADLLRETPTYWQAWYELGSRLLRQAADPSAPSRDQSQAAGWMAIESAWRANPRDPRLCGILAEWLWKGGRWDEARPYRDAQAALLPADRGLRLRWLQAEWRAGFTDHASQLAYRYAEEAGADPAGAEFPAWLAERELAEGSVSRARRAWVAAVARCPDEARFLRSLAQCERRLGYPDREAEWLRALTRLGKADAAAWWRLAELAMANADRAALQEALGMAVRLEPARRRAADDLWKTFIERQPPRAR